VKEEQQGGSLSDRSPEQPRSGERPFLQTLPGILAGITALGALVAVFIARDDGGSSSSSQTVTAEAATLPVTDSGSVSAANISWKQTGPRSLEVTGPAKQVWAHFKLSALPAPGRQLTVVWKSPDGASSDPVEKPRAAVVVAGFANKHPLMKGRWHAYLRADDQVIYDLPFTVSGSSDEDRPIAMG
jgi:hypothetical protein